MIVGMQLAAEAASPPGAGSPRGKVLADGGDVPFCEGFAFGGDDVGQGLLETVFGVADVEGGDAGAAVSDQSLDSSWSSQGIMKFGIDEVFDG